MGDTGMLFIDRVVGAEERLGGRWVTGHRCERLRIS